mgnify:CR=1 FL=1
MMAKLYINGLIGSKSNEELELAFEYLNKAISLGNIAAINTLGLMYQNGTYHVKKNIKKPLVYLNKSLIKITLMHIIT